MAEDVKGEETCYWKDVWQRLYTMRQMWQLCDLSLISEDGVCLKAHSIVLAASSSVFYAHLLNGDSTFISQMLPSELRLNGISSDVLQVTLDFIYGVVPDTIPAFKMLQKGADKLGIAAATTFCRQQLNEMEELAKGDNGLSDKPREVVLRTSQEEIDCCKSESNKEDRVNFPKCPYLTNMTAESSHIVPLKKRFLLKVLSQLKHEEAPLSLVVDVPKHDKHAKPSNVKDPEKNLENTTIIRKSVDTDGKHTTQSKKILPASMIQFGFSGLSSTTTLSTSMNQSNINSGSDQFIGTATRSHPPTIKPPLPAYYSETALKTFSKADDLDDVIPHHVPDLGFNDMGIQCPHLQRLVGPVDSYSGFPMDVIDELEDSSMNFDSSTDSSADLREKILETVNRCKDNALVPSSACPSSSFSDFTGVDSTSTLVSLQPNRCLIDSKQQNSNIECPYSSTASMQNLHHPQLTAISKVKRCELNGGIMDLDMENGKKVLALNQQHKLLSEPKTVNSCPVNAQKVCDTGDEEFQEPAEEWTKMERNDALESENGSFGYYSKQDFEDQHLEHASCALQMDLKEDMAILDAPHVNSSHKNPQVQMAFEKISQSPPLLSHTAASSASSRPSSMKDENPCHHSNSKPVNLEAGKDLQSWMPPNESLPLSQTNCVKSTKSAVGYHNSDLENRSSPSLYPVAVQRWQMLNNPLHSARKSQVKTFIAHTKEEGNHMWSSHTQEEQPQLIGTMPLETFSDTNEHHEEHSSKPSSSLSEYDSETSDATDPDVIINPENKMDNKTILQRLEMSQSEDKKQYTCVMSGCDYSNKNIEYVQSHLYHRHGHGSPHIKCVDCHRRYFSDSQLRTHKKQTHEGGVKCRLLTCDDCEAKCKNSQALLMHRLKAHGKGKLFSCEDCSFKSPRKKDLQGHMISQHGKAPLGVRVYHCELCDYKCIDRNRFSEHEASHTQQRSFQCDHCGNYYATRRGLRNHLKYHSNERPHKCTICNAAFKVRAKLRDHIRLLHLNKGEKPYKCGYCEFQAAVRGNVNQHIRNTHKGQQIIVIDLKSEERKHVKDYDYANMTGSQIKEVKDASAAGYASVGRV